MLLPLQGPSQTGLLLKIPKSSLRGVSGPLLGFPDGSDGKASTCNAGDQGLIPGSGRSPREGNGNPLQYSCLENPWAEEPGGLQSMMGLQRVRHDKGTNTSNLVSLPLLMDWLVSKIIHWDMRGKY